MRRTPKPSTPAGQPCSTLFCTHISGCETAADRAPWLLTGAGTEAVGRACGVLGAADGGAVALLTVVDTGSCGLSSAPSIRANKDGSDIALARRLGV